MDWTTQFYQDLKGAFSSADPNDSNNSVIYSVLFTKKNVYEKITIRCTTTDNEVLKKLCTGRRKGSADANE